MAIPELERLARSETQFLRHPQLEEVKLAPTWREKWDQARRKAKVKAKKLGGSIVSGLCAAAAPALSQITDHFYSVAAIVSADWAAWLWNPKAGLITLAVLLLAFEIKVGE